MRIFLGRPFWIWASTTAFILLGACATIDTQEIDQFSFIGDQHPRVTSSEAFAGALHNLGPSESLIVARAHDGGGALSQPSAATVRVVEPVLSARRNDPSLWLERCDVDGDGILDRHCPELFLALAEDSLATAQYVSIQSWYTVNANPNVNRDYWGTEEELNTADAVERQMPVTLKLLAANLGNKAFSGDMDVYVNSPPNITLGRIRLASKVVNRGTAKSALNTVFAILGAAAGIYVPLNVADMVMNDYANVESGASFDIVETSDRSAWVKVTGIELEPEDGITIEFDAIYEVID